MRRLRENCKVDLEFSFLLDRSKSLDEYSIMLHSVDGNLIQKIQVIQKDFGFMSSSVLIITHIFSHNRRDSVLDKTMYEIEGFRLRHLSNQAKSSYNYGYAIYVHIEDNTLEIVAKNDKDKLHKVETTLMRKLIEENG